MLKIQYPYFVMAGPFPKILDSEKTIDNDPLL